MNFTTKTYKQHELLSEAKIAALKNLSNRL